MSGNKMTRSDASRIQSSACRSNGGSTPKNSFASRAMSAAYKNEPYHKEGSSCEIGCIIS